MKTEIAAGRLTSLDAFRGATIAAMILVNNPGSSAVYSQFQHAEWDGWTFTDTIFPSFLWIVGVAMTFSFAKRIERGDAPGRLFLHVVRRAAIIFALGVFLYLYPNFDLSTARIPGVLQRIAVCYLVASAIYLRTSWKGQAIWTAAFLIVYWMLMTLVPVPGYGPGVLTTQGNLAAYVDQKLLAGHLYAYTKTWDPEGIVSTLPAIATTLLGILTGHLLRMERTREEVTAWLFVWGNALLTTGAVLSLWMPINKKLWTSPFALFMAGISTIAFAFFYWCIDVKGREGWARPFTIFGMNAIAVYVLSGLAEATVYSIKVSGPGGARIPLQAYLFQHIFAPLASAKTASLLSALAWVAVFGLIAYLLYRRRWFLKI